MINLNVDAKSVVEGEFTFTIDGSLIAVSVVGCMVCAWKKEKFVQRVWLGVVSNR